MSNLNIYVDNIVASYPNGTGSSTSPTELTNGTVTYYDSMGTIEVTLGQNMVIDLVNQNGGVTLNAEQLTWESGDHLGITEATTSGSTFTVLPDAVGTEEFNVIFSFNSGGNTYWCLIDPQLEVNQGS